MIGVLVAIGGVMVGAVAGYYLAGMDIWYYHLGAAQATYAHFSSAIVFGLLAGFYALRWWVLHE